MCSRSKAGICPASGCSRLVISAMRSERLESSSQNVRSCVAKLGTLLVAGIGTLLASGCFFREAAVAAIGSEIRSTDSALVKKLETISNPDGEGVVVFVRPESGCVPKYGWLWLGGRNGSYALDDASQALTPEVPHLNQASSSTLKRIGSDAQSFGSKIAKSVCRGMPQNQ
jgi:hypothetical protein